MAGLGNLAAYLCAACALCLLLAFFIAGAMSALIPEAITRFLGATPARPSYLAAAAAGSLLAVCAQAPSFRFRRHLKKGAASGRRSPSCSSPRRQHPALRYTGGIIGPIWRSRASLLSLTFGIGIGLIMALLSGADDAAHDLATDSAFGAQGAGWGGWRWCSCFVWVALLLAGTLKLDVLTGTYLNFQLLIGDAQGL